MKLKLLNLFFISIIIINVFKNLYYFYNFNFVNNKNNKKYYINYYKIYSLLNIKRKKF